MNARLEIDSSRTMRRLTIEIGSSAERGTFIDAVVLAPTPDGNWDEVVSQTDVLRHCCFSLRFAQKEMGWTEDELARVEAYADALIKAYQS